MSYSSKRIVLSGLIYATTEEIENYSVDISHSSVRNEKILRNFEIFLPKFHFILPNFYFGPP